MCVSHETDRYICLICISYAVVNNIYLNINGVGDEGTLDDGGVGQRVDNPASAHSLIVVFPGQLCKDQSKKRKIISIRDMVMILESLITMTIIIHESYQQTYIYKHAYIHTVLLKKRQLSMWMESSVG